MKKEVQDMSKAKRRAIFQKRMREFNWTQIALSALILGVAVLAARQLLMLHFPERTTPEALHTAKYLVWIITLAMMQLVCHLGQHIFKTVPWMKEFSEGDENRDIEGVKNKIEK